MKRIFCSRRLWLGLGLEIGSGLLTVRVGDVAPANVMVSDLDNGFEITFPSGHSIVKTNVT